ncbi:MAG: aminopeptidase [Lachnospiraceae bacterium]|nr:aminopeptidase [Lachnospiraceae bacterium]
MSDLPGYEWLKERYELAEYRLISLKDEYILPEPYGEYFRKEAAFLLSGTYNDLLPEIYDKAYVNPVYAVSVFGEDLGRMLSFIAYELTSIIPLKAEGDIRLEERTIIIELFLEVYTAFQAAFELIDGYKGDGEKAGEVQGDGILTDELVPGIKEIISGFITDYTDVTVAGRIKDLVDPSRDFAKKIIMESDLSDVSYLDRYGEYVSEDTRKLASFIASLPEDDIRAMAETFTSGFITGFAVTGKDISRKKTVNIRYNLGYERLVKASIEGFARAGLDVTIYRRALHAATRSGMNWIGYAGDRVNEQMDYDHKDDNALFLDKTFAERKIEVTRVAFEEVKDLASVFAGPAVMERFGMKEFVPQNHKESLHLSEKQIRLKTELTARASEIQNEYIKGDERSFTIISYPVPEIGKDFEKIFKETVDINSLPYSEYQTMQQCIIEKLEMGEFVEIKGKGDNRTDMRISLRKMDDITKQTVFENCVADVNIPVGEVFTSPVLEGTNGVLHVSMVYINGLVFRDLVFTFENGYVKDYICSNFNTDEENRRYITDNILHGHKTLPMGEFAIGTNTTAYVMAKRYGIFDKLPILIAEKTGPHFAIGDTCYSREEDIHTFNPDGRELVAKDNEHTIKYRKTDPIKAYYHCHTDITLPYEELLEIASVDSNGDRHIIINNGRFAVEGAEKLNVPLDEYGLK